MIFKTIKDDATGANKSLTILDVTLSVIKTKGIKGVFTPGLNRNDLSNLKEFNNQLSLGIKPSEAYKNSMKNCSSEAKRTAVEIAKGTSTYEEASKNFQHMSISAKMGSIALRGLATAGNMFVGWGISLVISAVINGIDNLVHSKENLQNSAKDLSSALKTNDSNIDSYKNKIKELHKIINNSSSSIADVTKARSNLMVVQDELIAKFGNEKGAIENITFAINEQTDALDELSKKSYYAAKNKFNEKTASVKFADWLSFGSTDDDRIMSNMDKMITKMRYSMYSLKTTGNEVLDNLIAKSYNLNISDDMYGGGKHFMLTGNLDEIQEKLYGIQEMSSNFDISTGFENSITKISNEVDTALQSYQDLYNQYILYEKILDNSKDNQYDEQFNAITEAKEAYDKAFISGDESEIQKQADHFAAVLSVAMAFAVENNDTDVADYFRNMYPDLQAMVADWEFSADFNLNTDDIKDKVSGAAEEFSTSDEIFYFNPAVATQEQIDAYGELNAVAEDYGMTLKQLIGLLEREGVVQSENRKLLEDKFGKDNVSKLSDEDLLIAYEVSDETIQSWDKLIAKIQEYKDNLKEDETVSYETITKTANSATEAVSTLRSAISTLNDAFAEQSENGSISIDTMLSLVDAGYATALQFDAVTGACTINRDAMMELVRVKIENQIHDLEMLQTDIQTKLREDGIVASESANGFYDLAKAKLASSSTEQMLSMEQFNDAKAQINALQNSLKNMDKVASGTYSTKPKSSSKSSSSDTLKDAFTQEYNTLKHNKEMEYITEKEYLDKLSALNQRYFAGKAEYLDDYRKYKEEVYKGLQSFYKSHIEDQMTLLEKQLDAQAINYQYYANTTKSLLDSMYRDGKISAQDYHSYIQKMLEKQLSIYDKALSAVNNRLDKEIDYYGALINNLEELNKKLEKQKDDYDDILSVVSDVYDAEIKSIEEEQKAIDDKIQALRDANSEEERAIALQKAKYELERAGNQRTRRVYVEGEGFVYQTDDTAIRSAQDNLRDTALENTIAGLEKERDSLNASIEALEAYKQKWLEISSAYDEENKKQLAIAYFGKDYEDIILSNRAEDIEAFKKAYLEIQSQINDNTEMIESYTEKQEYYENLKTQWDEIAQKYEDTQNEQSAAMLLGAEWEKDVLSGRLDTLNGFRNQYISLQQEIADAAWKSANEQINAAKEAAKAAGGTTGSAGSVGSAGNTNTQANTTQKQEDDKGDKPEHGFQVINSKTHRVVKSGFETKEEAEEYIGKKPGTLGGMLEIVAYAHGGIVKPKPTGRVSALDEIAKRSGEDQMIAVRSGEGILNPVQTQQFQRFIASIGKRTPDYANRIRIPNVDLSQFQLNGHDGSSHITIGDIHLHNVQNTDALAKAIRLELPSKLYRETMRI